jgi:hypothetical protein
MKTSGLRNVILKAILLILFCLYFLLVFSKTLSAMVVLPDHNRNFSSELLSSEPGPLPKLLSFEGLSSNRQVKLNWKFETTEGLDECIVERADKSGTFKPVAYFFMT